MRRVPVFPLTAYSTRYPQVFCSDNLHSEEMTSKLQLITNSGRFVSLSEFTDCKCTEGGRLSSFILPYI